MIVPLSDKFQKLTDIVFLCVTAFAAHHILSHFIPQSQGLFDILIAKETAGLTTQQLDAAESLAVPIASALIRSR